MLYLKRRGTCHGENCWLCRVTKTTLAKYLQVYEEGGIKALKKLNAKGLPTWNFQSFRKVHVAAV